MSHAMCKMLIVCIQSERARENLCGSLADDQILNQCNLCHFVAKYATNATDAILWSNLHLMQVEFRSQFLGPLCLCQRPSGNVFKYWPPGVTCISCKLCHQVAQRALVQNLVIRWRHLHCFQSWPPGRVTCIATLPWIALLALSVSIELVSSSARVTSVKFQKPLVSYLERLKPIDRTRDTWVR